MSITDAIRSISYPNWSLHLTRDKDGLYNVHVYRNGNELDHILLVLTEKRANAYFDYWLSVLTEQN